MDVGLGYIKLGQPSTTLSGGEAQRIKLATELSRKSTGKTIYILDEPTTGLHFEDVKVLMDAITRLVDLGNSFIIIEHNMDVVMSISQRITVVNFGAKIAEGTPAEIQRNPEVIRAYLGERYQVRE